MFTYCSFYDAMNKILVGRVVEFRNANINAYNQDHQYKPHTQFETPQPILFRNQIRNI